MGSSDNWIPGAPGRMVERVVGSNNTSIPKVCPKCHGSGTEPIIPKRDYTDDEGLFMNGLPLQTCEKCYGSGALV